MRLDNQVAIVTGVSHAGQIGFALADAFAREGARLAISARNAGRVQERARELQAKGGKVLAVPADLTSEEDTHALIAKTVETYGRVDILVNLAGGLTQVQPSSELPLTAWNAELNNNLLSAFLCTRAVWPVMRKQGYGKILNFTRAGGVQSSGPNMVAYNCAKAGIDALTFTFAKEGKEAGIFVNALAPGLVDTESNLEAMKPSPQELAAKWVSKDQVIKAALFLVTSDSDGVTGSILPVVGIGIQHP